jgi:hypothetical protein
MRLALSLLLLAALPLGQATADETISVYQFAGTVQCSTATGTSPDDAADLLRAQGVKVVSAQRRKLPLPVITRCGAPTGEVNVIEVPAAAWTAFTAQNADSGGYGVWTFDEPTIQVYKYDGTLQCGLGKEVPLDAMAAELTAAEIEILSSRKGHDGLDHIAVCGASTGSINVYTIPQVELAIAEQIGFDPLVTPELAKRIKPQSQAIDGTGGTAPLEPSRVAPADRTPLPW